MHYSDFMGILPSWPGKRSNSRNVFRKGHRLVQDCQDSPSEERYLFQGNSTEEKDSMGAKAQNYYHSFMCYPKNRAVMMAGSFPKF